MRKLKQKKGFTLIEMLACTVTLILIGLICSTGMNLATMSLRESTFESDSQMLESTLNMYLSDILRYSSEVKSDTDGTVISFTSDAYYIDEGNFVIEDGYLFCTSTLALEGTKGIMIANEGVYANTLFIKEFALEYDSAKGVFTGSYVIASNVTDSTKTCEFSFRKITRVS